MLDEISCPSCGQSDRAEMTPRREGDVLHVHCDACGHDWQHHIDRCPECGDRTLVPVRMPVLQKARGTQQSIIGYWIARRCTACGWSNAGPPQTSAT
jgi:uncharacterized Zn finger protein